MPDDVLKKAINNLSEHSYSRELHLYGQGEPLLDKRLFERIDCANEKLPDAQIDVLVGNVSTDTIADAFNSLKARKIRQDILYRKDPKWANVCEICDVSRESKIWFFVLPLSESIRQKIYSAISINPEWYERSKVHRIVRNSPQQIHENLIRFEELFQGNPNNWPDVISDLRNEFYASKEQVEASSS